MAVLVAAAQSSMPIATERMTRIARTVLRADLSLSMPRSIGSLSTSYLAAAGFPLNSTRRQG